MNRKRHNMEAGYVAERMNPLIPGTKVTIYIAAKQGIDVGPDKYAVVCDAHAEVCGTTSIPKARDLMRHPNEWCMSCQAILDTEELQTATEENVLSC